MSIWFHEKLDLAALSASGANCMPGFVGIECENRGIGGQGGGAEVTPTTRGAAVVGGLVAEFEPGFE